MGLTRSYLCLNAFAHSLIPSRSHSGRRFLWEPEHRRWRNELFGEAKGPNLQAVVAFGENAQEAVDLWDGKGDLSMFEVPHPTSWDPRRLLDSWRGALTELRALISPDPDGDPLTPNYGDEFREEDYARIPLRDLPSGVPDWLGDDSWGRKQNPRAGVPSSVPKKTIVTPLSGMLRGVEAPRLKSATSRACSDPRSY